MTSRLLALTTTLSLLAATITGCSGTGTREIIPFLDNTVVNALGANDNIPRLINLPYSSERRRHFRDVEISPDQGRIAYVEASQGEDGRFTGSIEIAILGEDQQMFYGDLECAEIDCEPEPTIESPRDVDFFNLDWSPDGTQLIADGTEDGVTGYSLYLIDLSRGSVNHLFNSQGGFNMDPSWGPDGRIYYRDVKTGRGILAYDLSTGEENIPFLQTDLECELPDVSEYGIVFSSDDETGSQDVYVGDFDGNIRRLTNGRDDNLLPQWSKDGRIFYVAKHEGYYSIDPSGEFLPRKLVSFD